jgi:mono/diheme cytochrome c family protein
MMRTMVFALTVSAAVLWQVAPVAAQDKAKAEAIFSSQKCTMCHSIAGKGNPKGALDTVGAKLKADEIRQWLVDPEGMREKSKATRTPAMKPTKLTKDQIDTLVAYLQTLK